MVGIFILLSEFNDSRIPLVGIEVEDADILLAVFSVDELLLQVHEIPGDTLDFFVESHHWGLSACPDDDTFLGFDNRLQQRLVAFCIEELALSIALHDPQKFLI